MKKNKDQAELDKLRQHERHNMMKMVLGGGEENEDHIMITEQDIVSNASP
jgi:hypothetical protein